MAEGDKLPVTLKVKSEDSAVKAQREKAARRVLAYSADSLPTSKLLCFYTATISGQVLDEIKPVPGWVIVAVPDSKTLRQVAGNLLTAQTDNNGKFSIPWAIPGDYLLFAVPPSDDRSYIAADFAERNQAEAHHLSLKPSAVEIVSLKPSNVG